MGAYDISGDFRKMRYFGLTSLAASAVLLAACGGGDKKGADTTGMMNTTADTTAMATTTTPATTGATPAATPGAAPAAGNVAAAPATGTVHEVKMIGDAKGYRFEPAAITVKAGDAIKYINVTGGPHNVAFDPAQIPADVQPQLNANMPTPMSTLSSPLLTQPNEAYTISFAKIKPGTYEAHCTPHLAMGMKQSITVQ